MNKYYSLMVDGLTAELDIYGDITSWPWSDSDVSAYNLSRTLEELEGVSQINVHINSYGGEVAEGLAIYNALRRHSARIVTTCDGMACSIASVIFMAGDERIMNEASLLMIHNAWTYGSGDAQALRKQADDLDTITSASKKAYLARVNITEDELAAMMDAETWLTADDAATMGFATNVESFDSTLISQSALRSISSKIIGENNEVQKSDDIHKAVADALLELLQENGSICLNINQSDDEDREDESGAETGEKPDADDEEADDQEKQENKAEQGLMNLLALMKG